MSTTSIKPKQKLPRSQKDKDWCRSNTMYYYGACQPAVNRTEALRMYRLANGELDEAEYLHVTNPLNTRRPELLGYPAKLKNHDIISPNVNLLMGEKARRFFAPIVYARNTNYQSMQLEQEQKLYVQELQKMWVNEVRQLGVPLDEEQMKGGLDAVAEKVKNLPDELSSNGQMALEYIMDHADVVRNMRKGFYDYVCTAQTFTYRDVFQDKILYDMISPLHFGYIKTPHIDFIEDGEACRVEHFMSVNEIYDKFQDLGEEGGFTDELKDFLDSYGNSMNTTGGLSNGYTYGSTDMFNAHNELLRNVFGRLPEENFSSGVRVVHLNWRSQAKIGKVTSKDFFNNIEEFEVSEDYKVTDGETVNWIWKDEIWESYYINDHYVVGCQPIPIQKAEAGRPSTAKLLYNGRCYPSRHTIPTSIVKKGESYQKSVNIIKYRAEESLAKNLDKLVLFPLGLIPKKEGWTEEKLMYYARAFSFLFYDDTRPNIQLLINGIKDLDLSIAQHILKSYELVRMFKMEWDEVCGFSPQRKAQISPDAPVGTTQIAQQTSSVMSEELFLTYEELERRDYACMLELGKYAFSNGAQEHFVRLDGTKAFLNIHDPDSFTWPDYGIFVKNGSRELQKLEMLRAQTQAFVQNSVMPGAIAKVIESDNYSELHKIMDEVDAKMEQRYQQDNQLKLQLQASEEKVASDLLEFKYYDTELKSSTDIQVALIEQGMQIAQEMGRAQASGNTDAYKLQQDSLEKNATALLQNSTKLREIASKERIAKDNNKTMLKNKVVGEK